MKTRSLRNKCLFGSVVMVVVAGAGERTVMKK